MSKELGYFEFLPEELVKIVLFNLNVKIHLFLYAEFSQFGKIYNSRTFISELIYYNMPYLNQKLFQDTTIFLRAAKSALNQVEILQLSYNTSIRIFDKYINEANGKLFVNNSEILNLNNFMFESLNNRLNYIRVLFPQSEVIKIYEKNKDFKLNMSIDFTINDKKQLGVLTKIYEWDKTHEEIYELNKSKFISILTKEIYFIKEYTYERVGDLNEFLML